jgi:glycosyltransferase involved in cell wall biosynthesis
LRIRSIAGTCLGRIELKADMLEPKKSANPLVSIVLPTYMRSHKLREAINSVRSQTYSEWELIVVDDNQPTEPHAERTETIVREYQNLANVVLIMHGCNKGACAARNTGIAAAKGDFIAFLDDDDIWVANKLALQVDALNKDSSADFVFCDLVCVDETANTRHVVHWGLSKDDLFKDLLKKGGGICTSALLIRKTAVLEIGGFDTSLPSYQDYDLLLRLALRYKHVAIDIPLLEYNVGADGISRNYEAKFKGKKLMIEKYSVYFGDRSLSAYYAGHLEVLGDYAVLNGRRWVAIGYFARSILKRPALPSAYLKLFVSVIGGEWLYRITSISFRKVRRLMGGGV